MLSVVSGFSAKNYKVSESILKKQPSRYFDPFLYPYRKLTLWALERRVRSDNCSSVRPARLDRILYVASNIRPYHFNGYSARTQSILKAMMKNGVDVVAMTRPGYPWDIGAEGCLPVENSTLVDGVRYWHDRHPGLLRPFLSYIDRAAVVIAKRACDEQVAIIHAASNFQNALPALVAARRLGLPFQYEMRGLWELSRASRWPDYPESGHYKFGLACEGLLVRHADRVFSISAALQRYAMARWSVTADRFSLLPNCVEASEFATGSQDLIVPRRIAYAGAMIAYEGLDTLIEAVALIKRNGGVIELLVMGDGEARPALENLSRQLGVTEEVQFLGKLPPLEARERLASCALICIPRKPFEVCRLVPPLKLVEALAMGKPVVVPDLPLFRDELAGVSAGWFFKSGDAEDLSSVLVEALSSPEALQQRGRAGRNHVTTQRRWTDHVQALAVTSDCE